MYVDPHTLSFAANSIAPVLLPGRLLPARPATAMSAVGIGVLPLFSK